LALRAKRGASDELIGHLWLRIKPFFQHWQLIYMLNGYEKFKILSRHRSKKDFLRSAAAATELRSIKLPQIGFLRVACMKFNAINKSQAQTMASQVYL